MKDAEVEQNQASPAVGMLIPWSTAEFVYHAYFGGGDPVSLNDIGVLPDLIKFSEREFYPKVNAQIMAKAAEVGSGEFKNDFKNTYDFTDVLHVLGKGTMSGEFNGNAEVRDGKIYFNGTISYKYDDEYTDPVDIRQAFDGTSDPTNLDPVYVHQTDLFATHYKIFAEWQTEISGSATLVREQ